MGKVKGAHQKSDKANQSEEYKAAVSAIRAKRQECSHLIAAAPFRLVKLLDDVAALKVPSRPSLPLAEAAKLAATCALQVYLNMKQGIYTWPDDRLLHLVLRLLNDAVQRAFVGASLVSLTVLEVTHWVEPCSPYHRHSRRRCHLSCSTALAHTHCMTSDPPPRFWVRLTVPLSLSCHAAGFIKHRSGLCAKLWATLGFLVEKGEFRPNFELHAGHLAKKLSDPRDDDIDAGPEQLHNKSQVMSTSASSAAGSHLAHHQCC